MLTCIEFVKYQGTGNDFIMLNNLNGKYDDLSLSDIRFLCNRKLGIGADGLIRLNAKEGYDFEVDYFNSDGTKSFCGNGARCSVAFAGELGLIGTTCLFFAIDGAHKAKIAPDGSVEIEMRPVRSYHRDGEAYVIDTGSPHYISVTENVAESDIFRFGREIRYSDKYRFEGINVNQMELTGENAISVRTYERGVEDETLSCGTGVAASALAYKLMKGLGNEDVKVQTPGGELLVRSGAFSGETGFENIWLCGPATKVFNGKIQIG